jgi:hypothetical protein
LEGTAIAEQITFSRLLEQDIDWGYGTREVRLQDNSLHTLDQFHVGWELAHRHSTFAAAVAAAQTAGRGVLVDAAYTISSNTTVAAAVPLRFTPPGVLTVSSGIVLTINGPIQAGSYQIFAGSGTVTLGSTAPVVVDGRWWGATGNGSTDDRSALNSAIAACTGHTLVLRPGTYKISSTLTVAATCHLVCARGAMLRPDAGITLTIAGGLEAGPYQIFNADGSTTGLVRFSSRRLPYLLPEWWGIDPTGATAQNSLWAQVIAAATTTAYRPILLGGRYKLDDSTNPAITLLDGTQLVGQWRQGNFFSDGTAYPARFEYYGATKALGTTDTGSSHTNLRLENLVVEDVNETGSVGLDLFDPQSLLLTNVEVEGFATGAAFWGYAYYGRVTQLKCEQYRTRGCVFSHNANAAVIDVQCRSSKTTIATGFSWSEVAAGDYGAQNQPDVTVLVEQASGTPVILDHTYGGRFHVYIETVAGGANYGTYAMQVLRCRGTQLDVLIAAAGQHARGLGILNSSTATSYPPNHLLTVRGRCSNTTSSDVYVEFAEGLYGIDISGLSYGTMASAETFRLGHMLGTNYHCKSTRAPIVDEGRGSTVFGFQWAAGDVVFNSAPLPGGVLGWVCTTAGNPGTWRPFGPIAGTITKTADFAVDANNAEFHYANTGASGTITGTLPSVSAVVGRRYRFTRSAAQTLRIDPSGSDIIRGGGAGKYLSLDSNGASVELENINGQWEILTSIGTTAFEP